jgi:hypothetical protein
MSNSDLSAAIALILIHNKVRREVQPTNGLRAAITRIQRHIHRRAAVSNRWLRQVGGAQCLEAAGGGVGEGALAEVRIQRAIIPPHLTTTPVSGCR